MKRVIVIALVYKTFFIVLYAQPLSDTTRYDLPALRQSNFSSITFDKLLNTYRWNGTALYDNRFGPVSLSLNERFTSSYVRIGRGLITDEQSVRLSMKYDLSERWRAASEVSSFILSDSKSIGISSASSHAFYGGIGYLPAPNILLEPLIGLRFDNQVDQHDRGVSYLLRGAADNLDYYGYNTSIRGKFQYDKLDPRTLETDSALVTIRKTFLEQTRNALQLRYYRNRRDFYFAADSSVRQQFSVTQNIETRAEHTLSIGDTLDYTVSNSTVLTFHGNITSRHIDRETRYRTSSDNRLATEIEEMRIEGSVQALYTIGNGLNGLFRFYYQERDEQHRAIDDPVLDRLKNINAISAIEEQKNNHSRRTSLSSGLNVILSRSDTVLFSGSGTLLRYDTPSATNLDDRDELWYILSLATYHQINRHLLLQFSADANLTHLVYISSQRSADNTWNRILRFSPRAVYTPSNNFTTMNRFEVLANYTVYDFEYLSSSTRSFSFRQFAFIDSSVFRITKRFSAEWFNYIRLYERGDLRWDDFSERPVNGFEDKTFSGTLLYAPHGGLLFSVGIRYFSQLRFGYAGSQRFLERSFHSIGPTTAVRWNVGQRTVVTVNGWFEHQSQTDQPNSRYANMSMALYVRI